MTSSEWEDLIEDIIDGVEQEVHRTARIDIKSSLNAFRTRLKEVRTIQKRRHFEQDLEAFLESKRFLRGAAERYVCKKMTPALEAATAAINRANTILAKAKTSEGCLKAANRKGIDD